MKLYLYGVQCQENECTAVVEKREVVSMSHLQIDSAPFARADCGSLDDLDGQCSGFGRYDQARAIA